MAPWSATTPSMQAVIDAPSTTSSLRMSSVTPAASAAVRSAESFPVSRRVATTVKPCLAAATAVDRPMPEDVPVTRATGDMVGDPFGCVPPA